MEPRSLNLKKAVHELHGLSCRVYHHYFFNGCNSDHLHAYGVFIMQLAFQQVELYFLVGIRFTLRV